MLRSREEVDRAKAGKEVAPVTQHAAVAGGSRGVARHHNDAVGFQGKDCLQCFR